MSIVIITGSTGLVGSESVNFFCKKGFEVIGVDNNLRKFFFGQDGSTTWVKNLLFKKNQTVISFVSTLNMNYLKRALKPSKIIIKAAPLPTIESKLGPVVLFPQNKKVVNFFKHLGKPIVAKNEKENNHLWTITSTMATFFNFCSTMEYWLIKRQVSPNKAKDMISSLMFGLSHKKLLSNTSTKNLVKEYQTKKGINEQLLKYLQKSGNFTKMNTGLTKILERIKKAND